MWDICPRDKSSDVRPWDLTLETDAESAARHIESDPTPSERKEPQPREEQEELHAEPLEVGRVLGGVTLLELGDPGHTTGESNIQTDSRDREPGQAREESKMRPKDRPVGRTCPINENLEEPIMITVEKPEIAGAKPEAPVLTPILSAEILKRRKSS